MVAINSNNKYRKNIELASQIFAEYGDFIYSIIHTKTQSVEKAEELYQDFFLSLVHNPVPDDVRNIKSFLYRAIINDITDAYHRTERYLANIEKYGKKVKFTINKTPSKHAFIEKGQIFQMLELIKEELPGSCFKAIVLRYRENQSIKEVAKQMGVQRASVSRYLSIGLKKIRQIWIKK